MTSQEDLSNQNDQYKDHVDTLDGGAKLAFEITPDDVTDLAIATRALYLASPGDVTVIPVGQKTAVTFQAVGSGVWPFRVSRVLATGTTASGIVGMA